MLSHFPDLVKAVFTQKRRKQNDYRHQLPHPFCTQKKIYHVVNHDTPVCPCCDSALKVRDSKRRMVRDSSGNKYIFALRRLYCTHCNLLHTEIPDCIEPYKRYFVLTMEAVKDGTIDYCAADSKTIAAWKTHP